VLFECAIPDDVESGLAMRHALEKATSTGADLRGADLRGAYLRGADLTGADLRGAYLRGAYLTGADLRGADLRGAYLRGADLTGADLTGADLTGADLTGAYLRGADLRGAYLTGADLTGADLTGADLTGADLTGAYLTGADLTGADEQPLIATDEEAIANLEKVRAIILDDKARLEMGHWHEGDGWREKTCAEEAVCGTTHCLAGWLQVCTTKPEIRAMSAEMAGVLCAPVAAKMFFRDAPEVFSWLEERKYIKETEEAIANRALAKEVNEQAAREA
jgi:hypothetical protein